MYNATYWLDRVVDEETEEVIQEGTDQSAGHFNNMEEGISDAHLATCYSPDLRFLISRSGGHRRTDDHTRKLRELPVQQLSGNRGPEYGPKLHRLHLWRPKCWSMTGMSET